MNFEKMNKRIFLLRSVLGDLLITIGIFFFMLVLIAAADQIINLKAYDTNVDTLYRNLGIALLCYFFGANIGYSRLSFWKGKSGDNKKIYEKFLLENFNSKIWKILLYIGIVLHGFNAVTTILNIVVNFNLKASFSEEIYSNEDLVVNFVVYGIPSLIFILKWLRDINYMQILKILASDPEKLMTTDEIEAKMGEANSVTISKPSINTYLIFLLVGILLLYITYSFYGNPFFVFIFLIVITLAIIMWNILGPLLTEKILDQIHYVNENKPSFLKNLMLNMMGIHYNDYPRFFINDKENIINNNDFSGIFVGKILRAYFTGTGIAFFFLPVSSYFIDFYTIEEIDVFLFITFILVFAPCFASIVSPVLWTIRELNIYFIDKRQNVQSLYDSLNNGPLQKVIGFSGFILGVSFYEDVLENNHNITPITSSNAISYALIFESIFILIILSFYVLSGTYITVLYFLQRKFPKMLETFRKQLDTYLVSASIIARAATPEEYKIFKSIK